MEGIVGLLQTPLGRLRNEQARREKARLARRGLRAGGRDPRRVAELVHREALAWVDREKTFRQIASGGGDVAPGVALESEVALLDPPHDRGGRVGLGSRVKGGPATQHRELGKG